MIPAMQAFHWTQHGPAIDPSYAHVSYLGRLYDVVGWSESRLRLRTFDGRRNIEAPAVECFVLERD